MNPQRIFFNERSVAGQAVNEHAAGVLIDSLAIVLRELVRHLDAAARERAFATSSATSGKLIVDTVSETKSFWDCLYARRGREPQAAWVFVQTLLRKGPWTEELLLNYDGHHCEQQRGTETVDLSSSSIAAAAALGGWVVSLRDCEEYRDKPLVVTCRSDQRDPRAVSLPHFIEPDDLGQVKRVYEHNPKHQTNPSGNIAGMDLDDNLAQRVLNQAAEVDGERRLFARHMNSIYVFAEHTSRHYHGFRIDDPYEYQHRDASIFNALEGLGWVNR